MVSLSAGQEQSAGRDRTYDNGLRFHNREDMPFSAFEKGRRDDRWGPNDLFAVFRTPLGEMRVQHALFSDFSDHACDSVARIDIDRRGLSLTQEDINFLVGMIVISRIHSYEFDDFLHMLDHKGSQIFDMRDLCLWISANSGKLFMSDVDVAISMDAMDEEGLAAEAEALGSEALLGAQA